MVYSDQVSPVFGYILSAGDLHIAQDVEYTPKDGTKYDSQYSRVDGNSVNRYGHVDRLQIIVWNSTVFQWKLP